MRPKYHFTPKRGWINDPNGMIYIDGVYHLFYQYYPDDIVWGPMHWGHAVSIDLVNWDHRDIAISPDASGYIFSGSCILDSKNVSGLGDGDKPVLLAFYTSHNPESGEQMQCVAYSSDYEHFEKYSGNPVIENYITAPDYKKEFRDPKVFENPVLGGYSMSLAVGSKIEFYHSYNLLEWTWTGEFTPITDGNVLCECPDCIILSCEGENKWILSMSLIFLDDSHTGNKRIMQYFIGDFDGNTFNATEESKEPLLLDYGPDNYAMVSFSNTDKAIMIGWGENWEYAAKTPASDYRGKMTLARSIELIKKDTEFRLKQSPIGGLKGTDISLSEGESVYFDNINGSRLRIALEDNEIIVDRSESDNLKFDASLEEPCYKRFVAKRNRNDICKIHVTEDAGFYEIFADEGELVFSIMTY